LARRHQAEDRHRRLKKCAAPVGRLFLVRRSAAPAGQSTQQQPETGAAASAEPPTAKAADESESGTDQLITDQLTADDAALAAAAESGMKELEAAWSGIPNARRRTLHAALTRRHKPRAAEVDEAKQ
jgi:hypothetical protein